MAVLKSGLTRTRRARAIVKDCQGKTEGKRGIVQVYKNSKMSGMLQALKKTEKWKTRG